MKKAIESKTENPNDLIAEVISEDYEKIEKVISKF